MSLAEKAAADSIVYEAGTASVTDEGKVSLQLDKAAIHNGYEGIQRKVGGELPITLNAYAQRVGEEAKQAAQRSTQKPEKRPPVDIRPFLFKVIVVTTWFYLDGALVMSVSAVVVRQEL